MRWRGLCGGWQGSKRALSQHPPTHAHKKGNNVLLDKHGGRLRALVSDFGLARRFMEGGAIRTASFGTVRGAPWAGWRTGRGRPGLGPGWPARLATAAAAAAAAAGPRRRTERSARASSEPPPLACRCRTCPPSCCATAR